MGKKLILILSIFVTGCSSTAYLSPYQKQANHMHYVEYKYSKGDISKEEYLREQQYLQQLYAQELQQRQAFANAMQQLGSNLQYQQQLEQQRRTQLLQQTINTGNKYYPSRTQCTTSQWGGTTCYNY